MYAQYLRAGAAPTMTVEFLKGGERHYSVTIRRPGEVALVKESAPGYDPLMPHDLLHFVVERALGLEHGIFGQVAAGGSCRLFHPVPQAGASARDAARERRAFAKRSDKLLLAGKEHTARSEAAVYLAERAWRSRSAVTAGLPDWISRAQLERMCAELDELSARWAKLPVGTHLGLDWPL